MLEDQIAEPVHELAALRGVHIPPDGILEGGARRLDGAIDVLRITAGSVASTSPVAGLIVSKVLPCAA